MFRRSLHIIFLIVLPLFCLSQNGKPADSVNTHYIDGLHRQLVSAKDDSARMMIIERIGFFYENLNADSSLYYINEALNIARQKHYTRAEARTLATLSGLMENQGRYAEEFELLFQSLKIAEENNSAYDIARANRRISGVYAELQNYPKAITYLLKALLVDEANNYNDKVAIDHYALADAFEKINKLDSASYHVNFAIEHKDLLKRLMQYVYAIDGHIKQKQGNYEQAAVSYTTAFREAQKSSDLISSSALCADFSALYAKRKLKDSAILYALRGFTYAKEAAYKKGIMLNGNLLAALYDSTQPSLSLQYYKIANAAKDSLYGINSLKAIEDLVAREEAKQKELEDAKSAFQIRLKLYGLLTGVGVLLVFALILFRNNLQRKKANTILQEQKTKVENALSELKSTQQQLIQSEKMASLGELTAGIAHEIQNPLNFVNNFSEVNKELIEEVKNHLATGETKSKTEELDELLNDIAENEEKINHHGKRADAIVRGMLQHSRTSTGRKELTDINALADEYLRLSYHGMRARDKDFNAEIETDFDGSIGKIKIVPQDIGRVLLNLYNNAFYATSQKLTARGSQLDAGTGPNVPKVTVVTKKADDKVLISVKDNGPGIPQSIVDKIFQPFFTTKPTGEGTGLGLSLAYDIIKAHGGEIRVETKCLEGLPAGLPVEVSRRPARSAQSGTKFVIQLPIA
jgi:signal transduction histidine kinase